MPGLPGHLVTTMTDMIEPRGIAVAHDTGPAVSVYEHPCGIILAIGDSAPPVILPTDTARLIHHALGLALGPTPPWMAPVPAEVGR